MTTTTTDVHDSDGPPVPRSPADVVDASITAALLHGVEGRYAEAIDVLTRGAGDVAGFGVVALAMRRDSGDHEFVSLVGDEEARALVLGKHLPAEALVEQTTEADAWGPLRFLPAERAVPAGLAWTPDIEKADHPDAWDPDDWFSALLLRPDGDVVGVLTLDVPFDGLRPDADTRARLADYVERTAAVLENLDQRHRVEQQLALAAASREVIRRADPRQGARAVVEACAPALVDALGADAAWFHVVNGPSVVARRGAGGGVDAAAGAVGGRQVSLSEEVAAPEELRLLSRITRHLWSHQELLMRSLYSRSHPGISDADLAAVDAWLERAGVTTVLVVPLGTLDEPLGTVVLARSGLQRDWSDIEEQAARDLGRDLGDALHTAAVFAEKRAMVGYKEQLIATVAHELRNPITAVLGNLDVLAELIAPTPPLEASRRAAERMRALVDDLLALSEADGPQAVPTEPAAFDEAVVETVDLLRTVAAAKEQTLVVAVPSDPVPVLVPRGGLDRVLGNLVSNAIKYTPAGGTVVVDLEAVPAASENPATAVLRVVDTGIGIVEEEIGRVFNAFVRSDDPLARRESGTGLGLAIVARTVQRAGGTVHVDSVHGEGSTFTVTLPLAPTPATPAPPDGPAGATG
ncbi:ATP-binding protein [Nocardioides zeae]|uniref:histidine kinase n=1 Tax=Nocardioides zeae TaxID=1457234 RepID=A0A6P0HGJ4_9ACTN|nr:HAMP domain-containing histidine kinase [Nocardioides zeae]